MKMTLKQTVICSLLAGIAAALIIPSTAEARFRYGQNYCEEPGFSCVKVKGGQSWKKLFPDPYEREVVKRLNRTNMRLYAGRVIAVPDNLSQVDLYDISPFPKHVTSPGEKVVVVDPGVLAWGAYDQQGNLVRWGPVSGGKAYCPDVGEYCRTIRGNFRVFHKKGAGCESKTFPLPNGGAPMPYCMFFKGGYALHASKEVPGYHASHGCIRIFKEDAKWLNQEFIELPKDGKPGTRVIINPYT
ncbi:MAG: L,D-transpeptidase [Legionellales bacterium]|nr:L,D-transpeptidase [Legionellales bacterium]|tara:strand:- start:8326 stop:9054 length:729 start_codon:yes stop_codon:yes gene_type:complete